MTFNEAYERYLLELQSNGITDKIDSNKQKFSVDYNESIDRLVEYFIEKKIDDDNRYIQKLKIIDKEVVDRKSKGNKDIFKLPKDYFDFISLNPFASKDSCNNQLFKVDEIKPENLNNYLTDEFTKPSFKYRESFYILNEDSITLFKEDFSFTRILLSYYRYPQHIELINKENPESDFVSGEIEFDDKFTNRVITLAAAKHSLNTDDPKFQTLIQQAVSKI